MPTEFYKHFSNELAPVLLDIYDFCESLTPWMLLLEKESCLSYIKKVIKKMQATDLYTTILKNRLQRTDTIVGENQSVAIKKLEKFYILQQYF